MSAGTFVLTSRHYTTGPHRPKTSGGADRLSFGARGAETTGARSGGEIDDPSVRVWLSTLVRESARVQSTTPRPQHPTPTSPERELRDRPRPPEVTRFDTGCRHIARWLPPCAHAQGWRALRAHDKPGSSPPLDRACVRPTQPLPGAREVVRNLAVLQRSRHSTLHTPRASHTFRCASPACVPGPVLRLSILLLMRGNRLDTHLCKCAFNGSLSCALSASPITLRQVSRQHELKQRRHALRSELRRKFLAC